MEREVERAREAFIKTHIDSEDEGGEVGLKINVGIRAMAAHPERMM